MISLLVSVLALLCYAYMREWLIVLALLCVHAVKLVDYIYPATLPPWLFASVGGVVLVMSIFQVFKRNRRTAAASVR